MSRPILALIALAAGASAFAQLPEKIEYNRDVRRILSNNCLKCHGPDDAARQGGLRLDTFEGATAKNAEAQAGIVPGNAAASMILQRITAADPAHRMPPVETGNTLTEHEIAVLRRWVEQGAEYQLHWSLVTPVQPALPAVKHAAWPVNGLDYFILQRLEAEGLAPSVPVEKTTLLRRVYLDLIGVPPSPREVRAFLDDTSAVAYEKVVQRLLDSPKYGERWARVWLDLARYADTKGYEADRIRTIWRYRDWVIEALNRDLPFDQFTAEQLAGDLLPNPTTEQLLATAFHRNTMTNDEGGTDNEEFRVAAVIDRANTTAEVWLGMTMACAQCHTHKYDPITHKEYYQFLSFFNQTEDADAYPEETPVIPTPTREQHATLDALKMHLANADQAIAQQYATLEATATRAAWEQEALRNRSFPVALSNWQAIGPFQARNFEEAFTTAFQPEMGIDLALSLADGALKWSEHADWADGQPHALAADVGATYLYRTLTSPADQPAALSFGSNDSIKVWVNGAEVLAKHIGRQVAPDQERVDTRLKQGENSLLLKIANAGGEAGFYFKLLESGISEAVFAALPVEEAGRTPEQQAQVKDYYVSVAPAFEALRVKKAALKAEHEKLMAEIPTTAILKELPAEQQRKTHILTAGSFLNPAEEVQAGTPAVLSPMAADLPKNRLGLAKWLTSPENPLTARVAVNRYWEQFFGIGIVETLEDFGTQGELPSHPALLDWLATEFIRLDWSQKELCRVIVTSAAYRQASTTTPALLEKDPYNRLIARGPRFRLDGEMVRDQALSVSGLLSDRMYGPSVMPPQPEGVWMVVYSSDQWTPSTGEDKHRRGLYTFWRRTSPYPSFITFDAPSREVCTSRRIRTNTPLQAFVTLNDPVYVEAAQALARRGLEAKQETVEKTAEYVFARATARPPRPEELAPLVNLYNAQLARYQADVEAAAAMASDPLGPLPEGADAAQAAAWTVVCNVILNLDEVLTKI